ncbi:ROK family protein [Pelagibacterium halotolerans]|uniref:ROK family transcriptional regulator n=1 Tax=Pelagibacterium halotolerans TaxID=531813 RepID=UPI0038500F95
MTGNGGARGDEPARSSAGHTGLSRGTNQAGVRLYNERLVLSLIRRNGALPKAEIARQTGLSPQTITIIVNQLEGDGLLRREAPQRGRVGQPSVPYSLSPEGALSFGLKIGRRSVDLVLMDLLGRVRGKLHRTYRYPEPSDILAFLEAGLAELTAGLTEQQKMRVAGIGIASPFELWNWEHQIGAPRSVLDVWRDIDIQAEVARRTAWPVYFYNDATSACAAELMLGNANHYLDFLYIFVGSFLGGGVVLNGSLFPGRTGYAGAIAPMPIGRGGKERSYEQILKHASLYVLAERMEQAGQNPEMLWREPDNWGAIGPLLDDWISELCHSLAVVILSATSIIDFEAVIIDGGFPPDIRARIVAGVTNNLENFDQQGLVPVHLAEGQFGSDARAMGGACLPLLASFTLDREVLFKDVR